jgi:CheY-like chemotaxis protein/predicted RNA-binding Zn-ribbon protein involved in translation (DUF1610 family)
MSQTILLLDDDEDLRSITGETLESLGYTVLETGDPMKAIQLARARPIDLLLTDVIMPLMRGTELADRIQRVTPRTKVVLMSGYMTSDIAPSGRPFLAKPFDLEGLQKRVREALERPSAFARRASARPSSPTGPEMDSPAAQWTPGEWYVVARCTRCRNDLVVAHDPAAKIASGLVALQPADGPVRLTCPACKHAAVYQTSELRSVHAK